MAQFAERGLFLRLIPILGLLAIIGLAPRSHLANNAMLDANRAVRDGSALDAANYVAQAAERISWQTSLWELAGHYALLGGDHQSAIEYLERAEGSSQASNTFDHLGLTAQGLTDLGDAYLDNGDLLNAIRSWQAVIEIGGLSDDIINRVVQAHLDLGDYPGAIYELARLIEQHPSDAQLFYKLGLLTATQDPETALNFLTRAVELDSNLETHVSKIRRGILSGRLAEDPGYSLLTTGRALAAIEEWELAGEAFRQSTRARPDYAEGWAYLGEALQQLAGLEGNSTGVRAEQSDGLLELQKALKLDPNSLAAHTFLAMYWTRHARYDLALDSLRSALERDPDNPVLQVQFGDILAASGDLHSAYDAYLQAIDSAPHDPAYQRYLVDFTLAHDFRVEEIALPMARRLIVSDSQDPENLDLMGRVLIKTGDLLTAERFLVRALQSDPDYAPAHLHLGLVYILRGDEATALQEFHLASTLAPNSPISDQATRLMETYFP